MPQSIPKGLTRDHVLQALADLDAGIDHPIGAPTGYELAHEGKRYPPKAVIGLAFRHLQGHLLRPEDFSGGEAPGQANFVLRELGFTVERKDAGSGIESSEEASERGQPWSPEEVDLIVADYFLMLRSELAGEPYSKADHNRCLQPLLDGRSKSSVEFKHQNISAVLVGLGMPYIDGYKPARNFQKAVLPQAVEDYLIRHPDFFDSLADGAILSPVVAPRIVERSVEDIFEERPDRIIVPSNDGKPWLSRKGKKIDFARRDAMNRQLGQLGEEFAVEVEKRRLLLLGRDDLAAKVEWVAVTCGDGVGFDILSFDEHDESEWWIEVKTTGLGKHFPFYVTANEVRCSEDRPERFRLYRVFDFSREPRVFVVGGALSRECQLVPMVYRASI
jgi:Domain of unknown function (DUF3883)